ncbi:MAG: haloacid dehalogenase-like hydrolase [Verrucomicrobia bacterium TMED56]|nr:MAG: haloacid dehalogenase-like hydrolase [Verrucomicrobia bacterium TMED56]
MTHPYGQNIVACIWDFDKTLIPGYMQTPLFEYYNINESVFWEEVNKLPEIYLQRGCNVSSDTIYLNHLLSYVKNGPMRGLTNQKLSGFGEKLEFCPGLPNLFQTLAEIPKLEEFIDHDFKLEHYIISTGLSPMIKGSKIFPFVEDVFACEFIESPLPPKYTSQTELSLPLDLEISQVGMTVDNTIKTRFIFEINKGSNKNPKIDVNSSIPHEARRIPVDQMIYVADGPSDVPVFAVVKGMGGKTYAVYDPSNEKEFEQSCDLVEHGRVHNNGPADYRENSPTYLWIKQKTFDILRTMIAKKDKNLNENTGSSPKHLPHSGEQSINEDVAQQLLW